jgi:hypothetical protein
MTRMVGYSRWWLLGAFVPPILIKFTDLRNKDYAEIENFYKYVDERRKGEYLEKIYSNNISKSLNSSDNSLLIEFKDDLLKSNKTVYDITNDLDALYLKAAHQTLNK